MNNSAEFVALFSVDVVTLLRTHKQAYLIAHSQIAYAVKRWHEKREEQKRKQEREERLRLRKVAKHMGSLVMAWWQELGKVGFHDCSHFYSN